MRIRRHIWDFYCSFEVLLQFLYRYLQFYKCYLYTCEGNVQVLTLQAVLKEFYIRYKKFMPENDLKVIKK